MTPAATVVAAKTSAGLEQGGGAQRGQHAERALPAIRRGTGRDGPAGISRRADPRTVRRADRPAGPRAR